MSTLGAEQREILASFAEEIRPLLADVVRAVQQLADHPGDEQIASTGLTNVRTLQAVIGFLELDTFQALLGVAVESLETLATLETIDPGQREAAWALAALLSQQGQEIATGDSPAAALSDAQRLVAQLATGPSETVIALAPVSQPTDLDDWLETLFPGKDDEEPAAATVDATTAETSPALDGASAFDVTVSDLLATLDNTSELSLQELPVEASNGHAPAEWAAEPVAALLQPAEDEEPASDELDDITADILGTLPADPASPDILDTLPADVPSPDILDTLTADLESPNAVLDAADSVAAPAVVTGEAEVPPAPEFEPTPDLSIEAVSDLQFDLAGEADEQPLTSFDEQPEDDTQPLGVASALELVAPEAAPDPLHTECGRLVEALAAARTELAQVQVDESTLIDLQWAARSAKGVASRAGHEPLAELCDLVERLVERASSGDSLSELSVIAFLTTAEEVVQQFVTAGGADPAWSDMVALLSVQLASLDGDDAESAGAAMMAWGDLPPEVLAELDGVEVEDLDDEALGRIAALLEAHDAKRASDAGLDSEGAALVEPAEEALVLADLAAVAAEPGALEPETLLELTTGAPTEIVETEWAVLSDFGTGRVTEVHPAVWDEPTAEDDDAAFEAEIRAVFLAEAEEHLASINEALLDLDRRPNDPAPLASIRRAVHTLKGASAAVGMAEVSHFCHAWEDALDADDASELSQSLLMECAEALERYLAHPGLAEAATDFADLATRLAELAGSTEASEPTASSIWGSDLSTLPSPAAGHDLTNGTGWTASDLVESLPAPLQEQGWVEPESLEPAAPFLPSTFEPVSTSPADVLGGIPAADIAAPGQVPAGDADPALAVAAETLRVPVARVDALVGVVGELVVQRSGLVERLERLTAGVNDLDPILVRLRRIASDLDVRFGYTGDLRGLPQAANGPMGAHGEFDELEMDRYGEAYQLSREILELASDLATTRRDIGHVLEDVQDGIVRQGRTTEQLHEQLLDVRLVPMTLLGPRLQRTVRQAALASGKEVAFALEGGQTLMDKTLLEEIADPLLHLLRNAVDHGIEAPTERTARGKASAGTIRVSAAREGKEIVVKIQDDGAGIDPARVLARARERGLVAQDTADDPNLAYELIFAPGFSTASAVTGLSGRGIGLDVVRAHLAKARGVVSVSSTPGQGTVFTLRMPALLVVTPVLIVRAGGQRVALPLAQVRRVLRVSRTALTMVGDSPMLTLDGATMPVHQLAEALGKSPLSVDEWPAALLVAVVAVGDRLVPLLIEDIVGQHEAVVKAPAPPFDILPGLAGTSVLGNGEVMLVLNLLELFGERAGPAVGMLMGTDSGDPAMTAPERRSGPPTVLVVDDSLSVRRVVARALTQHGWRVEEARDGLQALGMVRESRPDIMLLDVEMPRMDGFELASTLKRDETLCDLPIVMLTSRGGDKHRRKAFDLGVNAYLVKPYQESTLLETLGRFARFAPRGVA